MICCSVLEHLLDVSLSRETDPSSAALPDVSTIFFSSVKSFFFLNMAILSSDWEQDVAERIAKPTEARWDRDCGVLSKVVLLFSCVALFCDVCFQVYWVTVELSRPP